MVEKDQTLPDPREDGQTHINVFSRGWTYLGRMCSNFARSPFTHPDHGYFESMEGFYYWYSTGQQHDELRHLTGFQAKVVGRQFERVYCEHFEHVLTQALRCKFNQNPELAQLLKESELPLLHYYVFGGKVVPVRGHDWLVEGLTAIRNELKTER